MIVMPSARFAGGNALGRVETEDRRRLARAAGARAAASVPGHELLSIHLVLG